MKSIIERLENLMIGLNYCTTFGFEDLGIANSQNELRDRIKEKFPDSNPYESELKGINQNEFWEQIQFGFDFRGDYAAGMNLNSKQELELKSIQEEFKETIKKRIGLKSDFYSYSSEEGIPGYVVMWDFRLLFNCQDQWFFVYGSASD